MKMRTLQIMLLLGTISVGVAQAQSITYSTFLVPEAAPNTLNVQGISRSGEVDGYLTDTSGNLEGWIRDKNGDITLLVDPLDTGTPSATVAYGLSPSGIAIGYFFDTSANLYYGYFYSGGNYQTYSVPDQPSGTDTTVGGISSPGMFCGSLLQPPYTTYLNYVSIKGQVTVFQVEGSNDEDCLGINSAGTSVGSYVDDAGVDHGWIRDVSGKVTTVNVPAASTTAGTAPCISGIVGGTTTNGINDQGFTSGHYWDRKYNEHGFIRTPSGKFITLNVPGAYQTGGGSINANGEMVGHWATDTSCDDQGFIATINQ